VRKQQTGQLILYYTPNKLNFFPISVVICWFITEFLTLKIHKRALYLFYSFYCFHSALNNLWQLCAKTTEFKSRKKVIILKLFSINSDKRWITPNTVRFFSYGRNRTYLRILTDLICVCSSYCLIVDIVCIYKDRLHTN